MDSTIHDESVVELHITQQVHGKKKQNIIKTMFIKHHIQLLFHIKLLGQFSICNQDSHDLTTG
jgi:hypothetical protein